MQVRRHIQRVLHIQQCTVGKAKTRRKYNYKHQITRRNNLLLRFTSIIINLPHSVHEASSASQLHFQRVVDYRISWP